jgi:TIR domain
MRVFLCWSGEGGPGWRAAGLLNKYLPEIMDGVDTWFSETDIAAGSNWRNDLREALTGTDFCIVCVDRNSLRSPWVPFEVGFIAHALGDSSICPYLIGVSSKQIARTPLSAYQSKSADKDGTLALILSIVRHQEPPRAPHEQPRYELLLRSRFELYWRTQLEKEFEGLTRAEAAPTPVPRRPPSDGPESGESTADAPEATRATFVEPKLEVRKLIDPPPGSEQGAVVEDGSPFRLYLFNTTHSPRKGHVVHDWESIRRATGIEAEEVVVRDRKGYELPSQVDFFEYPDPTPSALVFSLLNEIPPGPEDYSAFSSYVTVERGSPRQWPNHPRLEADERGGRVRRLWMKNDSLTLRLELQPSPSENEKNWYAGAVTSVLLDQKEMLDAFGSMLGMPDEEMRCMQLDRLRLLYAGGEIPHPKFELFKNWYQLLSKSSGPVRAVITLASQPFAYSVLGSANWAHKCRLYRVISLYKGVNYVTEELKVYGTHDAEFSGGQATQMHFNTRYFSYMDVGVQPRIHKSQQEGWFALGSRWAPHQSYGFATDAELLEPLTPDPDYPCNGNEGKSFVWEVKNCLDSTCLHLFTSDKPKQLESEVYNAWKNVIDKPIVAKMK